MLVRLIFVDSNVLDLFTCSLYSIHCVNVTCKEATLILFNNLSFYLEYLNLVSSYTPFTGDKLFMKMLNGRSTPVE